MATETTKPWYLSKGVWGSVLVLVSLLLGAIGKPDIADKVAEESSNIIAWIQSAGLLVGGVLALWGRLTAKAKITT